jgi:hypothetical protein
MSGDVPVSVVPEARYMNTVPEARYMNTVPEART